MRTKETGFDFSSAILVTRNARFLENELLLKLGKIFTAPIETDEKIVRRWDKGSARSLACVTRGCSPSSPPASGCIASFRFDKDEFDR